MWQLQQLCVRKTDKPSYGKVDILGEKAVHKLDYTWVIPYLNFAEYMRSSVKGSKQQNQRVVQKPQKISNQLYLN